MNDEQSLDPRRRQAIAELSALICSHYPTATCDVGPDLDDPDITILWATVDVADTDQVLDLFQERQLQWQLEEDVPDHVVPIRTRSAARSWAPVTPCRPPCRSSAWGFLHNPPKRCTFPRVIR
jgi:hypothetical protein